MYGMIHKAIQGLVLSELGERAWTDIQLKCELNAGHFISGEHYPDDLSSKLLSEARRHWPGDSEDFLIQLGHRWIEYVSTSALTVVIDSLGDDLVSFIQNLDRMHASIKATMPEAKVPSFTVSNIEEHELSITYSSSHPGMAPFAKGIFEGVLNKFSLDGTVSFVAGSEDDTAVFKILTDQPLSSDSK